MALPSSGQISMNDIRVELGVPSQSPFGLNEARNGTYVAINQCSPSKPPATGQVSLSDWYGYNQSAACNYEVQMCSGGATYIVNATDITPDVERIYKIYAPDIVGSMNGTICWLIVGASSATSEGGATFGTAYDNCEACNASNTGTLNWLWTNNNVVEGGGGFIQIYKNGSNIVYTADTGNYTTTEYSGSFSYSVGDSIQVNIYSYANASYGTETDLAIYNPNSTIEYANNDIQYNPGSPSSETHTWTAVAGGITILASSNSY